MVGLAQFVQQQQVRRRTKGKLASVKFANELADAISKLGQVPMIGNVHSPGPHGRDDAALVTITASSDRAGVYLGYRRRGVKDQFDPEGSGTLGGDTANQFGEAPDDDREIYILNAAEESADTHALTEGGGDTSRTHVGFKLNMSAKDDKAVYVINGFSAGECSTS
jgi:plasmid stabilization system protein ParE